MLYFSYGSNMSTKRLRRRTPSAAPLGAAELYGHVLRFHKRSDKDGSGKCDAFETAIATDNIYGVVYRIDETEVELLDRAEGLGKGYEKKVVSVISNANGEIEAFTYYATDIDKTLSPLCWYKEHVLRGAEEHALLRHYIEWLKAVRHVADDDFFRREKELSIYSPE